MNTLKNLKYRGNNVATIGASPQPDSGGQGVFHKLSKRYANIKLLRSKPGRQAASPPVSTGSYDMRGGSEDLKREIGAPVLISKTCIDMDTTDCRRVAEPWRTDEGNRSLRTSPEVDIETNRQHHHPISQKVNSMYEDNDSSSSPPFLRKKVRSKSANNLHKSGIKVYLSRTSADLKAEMSGSYDVTCPDFENSKDSSIIMEYAGASNTTFKQQQPPTRRRLSNVSADASTTYSSKDSLNKGNSRPNTSDQSYSHDSLSGHENSPDRTSDEFNIKSASYQSLSARDLFMSIEELNEITRKINESDDFDQQIDHEYCEHRDQLRPDQRRITLLRIKNPGALSLEHKREKVGHAWNHFKNWVEEEGDKIKEVVHKHAAMQRVGGVGNEETFAGSTRNLSRSSQKLSKTRDRNACDPSEFNLDNDANATSVAELSEARACKGSNVSTASRFNDVLEVI